MKIKNNGVVLLGLMALLSSCEPQEFTIPDADSYSKVFNQAANQSPVELTVEMEDAWNEIPIGAGFGGFNLPESDITVTFKIDTALVNAFNKANGTHYPAMPEGSYEFPESTVVIEKGSSSSESIFLKVNPSKFGGIIGYLLPVTIQGSDGGIAVNEDLKTAYYLVKGKYSINPYTRMGRSDWSIADFSTDENESVSSGGRASHALDGSMETFWATQWRAAKPRPPHHITIDMGSRQDLHGIYIGARMAGDLPKTNGNPKEIRIETSTNGVDWTYSQSYSIDNLEENEVWLDYTQQARFFKIVINESHEGFYGTHISEINAF